MGNTYNLIDKLLHPRADCAQIHIQQAVNKGQDGIMGDTLDLDRLARRRVNRDDVA